MDEQTKENYRRQMLHLMADEMFPPTDRFDPSAAEQDQRMADFVGLSVEEFRITRKNLRRAVREDGSSRIYLLDGGTEPSREEAIEHFLSFRPEV